MIVIDASAIIDVVAENERALDILDKIETSSLFAPHIIDFEVLSGVRGMLLGRDLDDVKAQSAIDYFYTFDIQRFEAAPLAQRIWELRHQFTSYDASYIALAEHLDCPLITSDKKLATSGHNAEVLVF
ncbi:MAG: type II toxin-antitoxin system VapC family toxin [Microbacteriaceae bacterium]|nr:type II toxin-antitoxin system VapC family toxin [Microbacteriaceae bacterium]